MEPLIRIEHLSKSFGDASVLRDINLTVNKGDVVCIIGSSGGGKSTLLRCINLLENPTSGAIYIDGENILGSKVNVDALRAKTGMVFQQFNLFNHLNVLDNCTLAPIKVKKLSKKEATEIAIANLTKVGMGDKLRFKPRQLSGGQKQRVAIARALCMNPKVLLFDEPTSALDPEMVDEVLNVIKRLASEGMTMVVVTHEMSFARHVANKIVFIDQGVAEFTGTPDEAFSDQASPRLRQFMKDY
ncbi:MAG TPA: amino acid ABC transporter ATP-binding protein [Bacilli bacterium]|nr:amino acid ABC transporter ATP-binding protein [Bacilli bacterium]HPS18607.1 amino acid ABC transporter ATP-binding protein [Bacilli bacterium]